MTNDWSLLSGIVGVQIREMRVPPVVESGKHPHVILDCDYDLTENEGRQARVLLSYIIMLQF